MDEIPSESRVALSHLLSVINRTGSRNITNKEVRTFQSRQQHFIKFLNNTKLGNNVSLKGFSQNVRNTIMACYTAYLASGQNLICKTIKAGTISRYLNAAAELSVSENMMNPCLDTSGKQ